MMKVSVLYFEGCPNHPPAVELVQSVAAELGIDVEIEVVDLKNQADAERLRFFGSPTIQVDGVDIESEAQTRTDFAFSCRMYNGQGLPPREMVVAALAGKAARTGDVADQQGPGQRVGLFAAGGSLVAAIAASACCWLPLLLIAFGLSAGGAAAWFAKYRLLFLGVTVVLLGTGFYLVYFRKPVCEPGAACAVPNPKLRRFNRIMLWVATAGVITFAFFPNYAGFLLAADTPTQLGDGGASLSTVKLRVDGMFCDGCAIHVRDALAKVPGVQSASVSYAEGLATVAVDASSPPSEASLVKAVEGAGYKATMGVEGM